MKYSKSNATTIAIVFAICTLTAITLGTLVQFYYGSADEAIETPKKEKNSTADIYKVR